MSTLPPPFDPADDADEQYRRASELDPSRPSEATRRAVLAHAARLAAERARRDRLRRWLSLPGSLLRGRPAVVGTLAAAVLVAVVLAPQLLAPRAPTEDELGPATAPQKGAAAPPARTEPTHEDRALAAAPVEPSPRAAPANATQPAVVTGSRNRASKAYSAETAPPSAPVPAPTVAEAAAGTALQQGVTAGARARVAPVPPSLSAAPPASEGVSAGPEALRRAAAAGDVKALTAQLASGTDIDARDAQGRTALLLATLNGRTSAVAVLLAQGADPSAADARGATPLQAAIAADDREIVSMLRRYGAR